MKRTIIFAAALGCGIALLGTPSVSFAQVADQNADKPVSLNFQNAQISSVLKALFSGIGANYSIDSNVQGTVNITMNNVGFLAALRSLLHANNPPLSYDYTDAVYHIRVRAVAPAGVQPAQISSSDTSGGPAGSSTSNTPAVGGDKRYYKLPIDHYDVARLLPYLLDNKGTFIVPATGNMGTGTGGGGMGGGGMGGGGMSGGGMGMGGGMGGGGMSGGSMGMGMGGGGMSGGMAGGSSGYR